MILFPPENERDGRFKPVGSAMVSSEVKKKTQKKKTFGDIYHVSNPENNEASLLKNSIDCIIKE